MYNIEQEA